MKTTRFFSTAVLVAALMSVNLAYAQIWEAIQFVKGVKSAYDLLKKKEDKAKVSELRPVLVIWSKLQQAYIFEHAKSGDCDEIGFKPPQSTNFSYECGKKGKGGSIAFLKAKTKNDIGDCPAGTTFEAKFDSQKGYFEMSLEPIRSACVFFEGPALTPAQKKAAEDEIKQGQAKSGASGENEAYKQRAAPKMQNAKNAAKGVKQEQYPCKDSQNRTLYCSWDSGCYAIDPRYADPPGGTCDSHIETCQKWGALFVGVTKEGAGIRCSNVGGTAVSK